MKAETILGFAKLAAVAGAGIVAVKVGVAAKKKIDAGMKAADALAEAAKETAKKVVTKDLNPASTENLAYRGVNYMGRTVTNDPGWNLGNMLWEAFNPSKVAQEKGVTAASVSNTKKQGELIGIAPSQYVAANWEAMNAADAAVLAATDAKMSNSRSAFRAAELQAQKEQPRPGFLN